MKIAHGQDKKLSDVKDLALLDVAKKPALDPKPKLEKLAAPIKGYDGAVVLDLSCKAEPMPKVYGKKLQKAVCCEKAPENPEKKPTKTEPAGKPIDDKKDPFNPDFDGNKLLNINDFMAFMNSYAAKEKRADANGDGKLDASDFKAFAFSPELS